MQMTDSVIDTVLIITATMLAAAVFYLILTAPGL
jgi:hypothetical protein